MVERHLLVGHLTAQGTLIACHERLELQLDVPCLDERRVHLAQWHDAGNGILTFDIRANAFCHQMVRSIVGTLVDVGLGRRKAGEMSGVLRAMSRLNTPHIAPPQGLCLMDVGYPS